MERPRYILRDERFGGTLFDRKLLRHTFLSKSQLDGGIFIDGEKITGFEHWRADTSKLPIHIPFSPTRIYFEITNGCNLRCKTCFNASAKPHPNEMDTETAQKCLSGLRSDHVFDIRFSGGEITTRPNWFKEVNCAKLLGFAVSVNTNGVYKHPETIDQLAALGVEQITVSIDGNQQHHDQNRGKRTHARSLKTLQTLKAKGAILRTNTVLTTLSINDAETIIQDVGEYVDEMAFFHMRMTGRAQRVQDRMVGFSELDNFVKRMDDLKAKYPHIRFYYGERAIRENSVMPNSFGLQVGSPDGLTRMNLLADGSVWAGGYTAYIESNLNLGNLRQENYSILNIWRNSSKLAWYREFGKKLVERCLKCPETDKRCPGVNVEMELIRNKFPHIGNPNCIY